MLMLMAEGNEAGCESGHTGETADATSAEADTT